MTREITTDWPFPGEWESVEDVSKFYKDRLYPALSEFVASQAEGETYIDYVQGPFTIGNLTIGSVMFAGTGGVVSQDNDDFFWDATNIRLGINVGTSPSVTLDVGGDVKLDGAVTINDAGADKDTRIEGLNDTELFFVDASTDRVGISTTTPTALFNVAGDSDLDGSVIINESNADKDFRVEGSGASFTHLLFTDASANKVGINTSTPNVLFHIFDSALTNVTYHPDAICAIEASDSAMYQVSGSVNTGIVFCDATSNPPPGAVIYDHSNEWMEITVGGNELLYIKNGYVTTADGIELAVGDFGTPTNPFQVKDEGTTGGWGGAYGGVVARFTANESKHTAIVIDALTGYDPVLGLCENGAVVWAIRNDASATDKFQIRYHVGEANRIDFQIDNVGNIGLGAGASWGTNAAGVYRQDTGTDPASSPADCFQMYSADIVADHAALHIRNENNTIIKIYQQAHIADAVASHTLTDASETCDRSEIEGFLDALGVKINTIYTALETNGLLASA